jgi:tRNA1(Val) A37 N6-methylase TrmN6
MAKRMPSAAYEGFDINPDLIALAVRNSGLNGAGEMVRFFVSDLREHRKNFARESYDVVVMNPPYDEPGTSRPSSKDAMAEAMHGKACTLSEVVDCAKYLLRNGGKFFLVIRAKRVGELFHLLYERNIKPKRFRAVHPKPGRPASVALVEAVRASGSGMTVENPLFIHDSGGEYTEALLEAYRLSDGD